MENEIEIKENNIDKGKYFNLTQIKYFNSTLENNEVLRTTENYKLKMLIKRDNIKKDFSDGQDSNKNWIDNKENIYDNISDGIDLNDYLDKNDYENTNTLQIIEYKNLEKFYSEIDVLINSIDKDKILNIILINFESQNTYTIHFYEPNDDIIKKNTVNSYRYDESYEYQDFLFSIRYFSTLQAIVDKTLISLNNNHVNIQLNYYSRIMDLNTFTKNIYLSENEEFMCFFSVFYFL